MGNQNASPSSTRWTRMRKRKDKQQQNNNTNAKHSSQCQHAHNCKESMGSEEGENCNVDVGQLEQGDNSLSTSSSSSTSFVSWYAESPEDILLLGPKNNNNASHLFDKYWHLLPAEMRLRVLSFLSLLVSRNSIFFF